MNIEKPMGFEELFAYTADIFKKIFPRVFIIYALLGALPGALYNAFVKPGAVSQGIILLLALALMVLAFLVMFIIFFYTLAGIKNEPLSLNQCFEKIGEAVWPVITVVIMGILLIIAVSVALAIIFGIFTAIGTAMFLPGPKPGTPNPAVGAVAVLVLIPFALGIIYLSMRCYFVMNSALMDKTEWFTPFKQSWRLTKGNFGKVFVFMLIFMAYGYGIVLLKFGTTPLASFVLMLVLSPIPFFLSILFNILFFNLYYSKK
ncbi:MAG: hypothetical protein FWF35_05475 [Elusimicrobia bacterium]|nr:hypothetical protein [Elusimicrobiota bacterium]